MCYVSRSVRNTKLNRTTKVNIYIALVRASLHIRSISNIHHIECNVYHKVLVPAKHGPYRLLELGTTLLVDVSGVQPGVFAIIPQRGFTTFDQFDKVSSVVLPIWYVQLSPRHRRPWPDRKWQIPTATSTLP